MVCVPSFLYRCCLQLVSSLIADDKAEEAVEVMRRECLQQVHTLILYLH